MSDQTTHIEPELIDPKDSAAILRNTKAIGPIIDEEAAEIEALGCLTPRMKDVLARAGCFRIAFPARLGGPEMSFRDQVRMIEFLSARDGSVGWNVKILSDSGFYASRLSAEAYTDLYPSIDSATAGSFTVPGRADVVGDEFEVTGQWSFGSGVRSADQVVGGVNVYHNGEVWKHADGAAVKMYVYLPLSAITIKDDWHVTGMRGSSSNTYSVDRVRVSASHSFVRSAPPDPAADPLNRHVELPFFNGVGITLGLASHALEVARKKITSGGRPLAAVDGIQRLYGEAWCHLDAAHACAYAVADGLDDTLFRSGTLLDDLLFARMVSAPATVAHLCKRVVDLATEMNGAVSIYTTNEMERVLRDMQTNLVHLSNSPRRWVDAAARVLTRADREQQVG